MELWVPKRLQPLDASAVLQVSEASEAAGLRFNQRRMNSSPSSSPSPCLQGCWSSALNHDCLHRHWRMWTLLLLPGVSGAGGRVRTQRSIKTPLEFSREGPRFGTLLFNENGYLQIIKSSTVLIDHLQLNSYLRSALVISILLWWYLLYNRIN